MAEPDSIGTGKEKVRALTFDKDTVEKIGKTFEVISEIKIVQDSGDNGNSDGDGNEKIGGEEEKEYDDNDDEKDKDTQHIPTSSQLRPAEKTQNHAQNQENGTMGRKIW